MRLLLDTHLLLWALAASRKLPVRVRTLLVDAGNDVLFSGASVWEIAIKSGLRRDDFRVDIPRLLLAAEETGFDELAVTSAHAARVVSLPALHRDPFDRLLIAQAQVESAVLLTNDVQLGRYGTPVRVI